MNKYNYLVIIIFLPLFIVGYESLYQVDETEQVILTQFGKPIGGIDSEAGLKIKR